MPVPLPVPAGQDYQARARQERRVTPRSKAQSAAGVPDSRKVGGIGIGFAGQAEEAEEEVAELSERGVVDDDFLRTSRRWVRRKDFFSMNQDKSQAWARGLEKVYRRMDNCWSSSDNRADQVGGAWLSGATVAAFSDWSRTQFSPLNRPGSDGFEWLPASVHPRWGGQEHERAQWGAAHRVGHLLSQV